METMDDAGWIRNDRQKRLLIRLRPFMYGDRGREARCAEVAISGRQSKAAYGR